MDIPDVPVDSVRFDGTSSRSLFESFINIFRTMTVLINLDMVSDWMEHPSVVFLKVSSRSDTKKKLVKNDLEKSIFFLFMVFEPSTPPLKERVQKRVLTPP